MVKTKRKFDRWMILVFAILLWALGTILVQYGFMIPALYGSYQFWLRLIAVIIAVLGWIWVFRIYLRTVLARFRTTLDYVQDCHNHLHDELSPKELEARKVLIEVCREIVEEAEDNAE